MNLNDLNNNLLDTANAYLIYIIYSYIRNII